MRKIYLHSIVALFAVALLAGQSANAQLLFDNGPIVTHAGQGAGGTDLSVLQDTSLNLNILGVGHQVQFANRVADDFVVPSGGWIVDSIVFYAYQTGSPTTSPITTVRFQVWDTIPYVSGGSIVFGDTTTNRMTSTKWSGAWRVTQLTMTSTQRPIMRQLCVINGGMTLSEGTHWIEWQSDGNQSLSGPWCPVVSIMGKDTTGNGMQSTTPGVFFPYIDDSTLAPQGFPFILYGKAGSGAVFANAGNDTTVCPNSTITIGGNPAGSGGQGSLSYSWSPINGLSNGSIANPTATVTTTTTYVLTVTDSVGKTDTSSVVITVGPVSAELLGNDTTICDPNHTLDAGSGYTSYNWSTGANTQTITIGATGTYFVQAMGSNGCTYNDTINLTFATAPVAAFTYSSSNGITYTFVDGSTDASSWLWDFGDGNTSNNQNPMHTFGSNGTYTVKLTVDGACGTDTSTQTLNVISREEFASYFQVYPNPAKENIFIKWTKADFNRISVSVISPEGKSVLQKHFTDGTGSLEVSNLSSGLYFVVIRSGDKIAVKKIGIE